VRLTKLTTAAGDHVKVDLTGYRDRDALIVFKQSAAAGAASSFTFYKGSNYSGVSTANTTYVVPAATAAASSMTFLVMHVESAKFKKSTDGTIRFGCTASTKVDSVGVLVFV